MDTHSITDTAIIWGAIPEETRATWNAMLDSPDKIKVRIALLAQIRQRKKDLGLHSIHDRLQEIDQQE